MDVLELNHLRYVNPTMYIPLLQSPLKRIISLIASEIADLITPTIELIGPVIGVIVIGGVLVVALVIWYEILSIEGHRLERPDPLE